MTLLDFRDYPEIHSDGIGELQFIGSQAHLLLFRWHRIDGIWQPVIVVDVVRPAARMAAGLPHTVTADLAAVPNGSLARDRLQ